MRADARRNLERILDAAREQITAHGPDVSMQRIARAAGVAVGTLYRHHPTKTHLVQAILTEHSAAILARAEEAARSASAPGEAMARLEEMLADLLEEAARNRAVKEAAAALGAGRATTEQEERGRAAVASLLRAALADGDLRPGVTADDVYLVMAAAPASLDEAARHRWLEIVLAGLGTRRTTLEP